MSHYCAIPAEVAQARLSLPTISPSTWSASSPWSCALDQHLDVRLVGTFLASIVAILQWRNRSPIR